MLKWPLAISGRVPCCNHSLQTSFRLQRETRDYSLARDFGDKRANSHSLTIRASTSGYEGTRREHGNKRLLILIIRWPSCGSGLRSPLRKARGGPGIRASIIRARRTCARVRHENETSDVDEDRCCDASLDPVCDDGWTSTRRYSGASIAPQGKGNKSAWAYEKQNNGQLNVAAADGAGDVGGWR